MVHSLGLRSPSGIQGDGNKIPGIRTIFGGAPFDTESCLVQQFSNFIKPKQKAKANVITELDSGNGIADIVCYSLRGDWKRNEVFSRIKPQLLYAYYCLPYRKVFATSDFEKLACISEENSYKALQSFSALGLCNRVQSGWIKMYQPTPPASKIYAIEAKLRNWKKALYQATRYLEFANQSWVLLDDYYSKSALKNAVEFKKRNIGLLTINTAGDASVRIHPKESQPKSMYRYWYVNNHIIKAELSL